MFHVQEDRQGGGSSSSTLLPTLWLICLWFKISWAMPNNCERIDVTLEECEEEEKMLILECGSSCIDVGCMEGEK